MTMSIREFPRNAAGTGAKRDHDFDTSIGISRLARRASRLLTTRRAEMAAERGLEEVWFWRMVKLEVERARRSKHAFTVLCVEHVDSSALTNLATRLRPHLRTTDGLLVDSDRLLILLGETAGEDAQLATQRLARISGDLATANSRAITFPRDAITFGALVGDLLGSDADTHLSIAG